MNDIILAQLLEHFKTIIEEIMLKERRNYLLENSNTRANGYYTRTPKTILGEMELNIPRTRDGKFKSSILPERKRAVFMLDEVVRALFISGVSSRKVGEIIKTLIGSSLSHSFISSTLDIAEEVISEFKSRKLVDDYPVLYIDATYVALKRDSVEKEAVYVVLGLKKDGSRDVLAYYLPGGSEKASVWKEILEDLRERGLKSVRMIISDDLAGLDEAITDVFPSVEHQLCWFHLKRNIKNRVRKRHWDEILRELNEVMNSDSIDEGREKMERFIEKWSRFYRFLGNLGKKVNNYTYFLRFHRDIRSYFRTTNWLERCFKELKDYIRVRGYFHTEGRAEKFLYLFFSDKGLKYRSRKLKYSELIEEAFANE